MLSVLSTQRRGNKVLQVDLRDHDQQEVHPALVPKDRKHVGAKGVFSCKVISAGTSMIVKRYL